jgi:4-amino-4-deoxy-L-arabinose transferase-like glycosyltransferase
MTIPTLSNAALHLSSNERPSRLSTWAKWVNLPLAAVLILQLASMLSLQNTPFQDEALYLYAGHRVLDSIFGGVGLHQSFSSFFSGLPYFYPVIGAALDQVGGYELARAFSTVCVLFITFAAYRVSRALFGGRVGLLAAAICATSTSLIFVGRLATYDALSFALFAGAAMIAVETTHRVVGRTVAVVILCFFAILAKYAVAAVVPAALLLLWLAPGIARNRGARVSVIVTAIVTFVAVASLAWLLLHSDQTLMQGLTQTTTNRAVSAKLSLPRILSVEVRRDGIAFALALIGLVSLVRWGVWRRTFMVNVLVLGIALTIPLYHAYMGEIVSVDKHLGLTTFLLAPLAGLALDELVSMRARIAGWTVAATILVLAFSAAITDASGLFHNWPNSTALHTVMLQTVRDGDTRVLAEEIEVPEYDMVGSSAQYWQFTGLDFFQFSDGSGDALTGRPAYKAAIGQGYFGVIVLRFGPSALLDSALEPAINKSGLYDKVSELPYTVSQGTGAYTVWRRNDTPAPGAQKEQKP